jgi:hypothetical protein
MTPLKKGSFRRLRAVLVAGVVFQIIGRLRQVRLTHSHYDAGAAVAQSVEEAVPVSTPTRSKSFGHAIAQSGSAAARAAASA